MARRIQQVDVDILPIERDASRVNRDAAVLFFGIIVGGGVAVVDIAGTTLVLEPGEWSTFARVTYDMMPMGMMAQNGIVRFYLRSVSPELELGWIDAAKPIAEADRGALQDRDHTVREMGYARDPMNKLAVQVFGDGMVDAMVEMRMGRERMKRAQR